MVVSRFKSSEDEVNGYYLLAQKGVVRGLRRGFFEINDFMLKYLDEEGIKYEVVDEDVLNETVFNVIPAKAGIQTPSP